MPNKVTIQWQIDLGMLIGQKIVLLTHDGFIRKDDRLTGVEFKPIEIQGVTADLPYQAVLNNSERFLFTAIKGLRLKEADD